MKKRIIGLVLCIALVLCLALSLASCETVRTIYDIANSSYATTVVTVVNYSVDGDDFQGYYKMETSGNDSILNYHFDRYTTREEGIANPELGRISYFEGKIYYIGGVYYTSGDETLAPWVGSPRDLKFNFKIEESKLTNPVISEDGNTLTADMTNENCLAMFGFDLDADGTLKLEVKTNGVNVSEVNIGCTTVSGATVTITNVYDYGENVLDFSEIFPEEEAE